MVTYFNSSLQSSLIGSLADIVLYNILTSVTNLSIGWEHRRGRKGMVVINLEQLVQLIQPVRIFLHFLLLLNLFYFPYNKH